MRPTALFASYHPKEHAAMTADTLTDTLATAAPTHPAHWRMARLGDFIASCALSLTNGFAQGGFNENGQGVPHLRPFNVTDDGRIDLEHIKSVPAPRADSGYWIQQGDIIFNNTNSEELVGKTAYFPFDGKFVLSNHMTRIRVLDSLQIDAAWLAYQFLLQWDHRVFKALCRRHVGQASISLDKLSNLTIPLPPLAEQRAIARILRAAQDAIAARRREVELERERKAAFMQRLFTHGVRGEPTKQTEIGEMPQSWRVVRLQDFLREPLKNGVSAPEAPSGEGIRTLTLSAVTKDDFSIGNTKVTTADPMRVRDLWLQSGDLFIERANTQELVGSAAMYYGPDRFAIYPDLLIRVRTRSGELDAGYLLEYLRTGWCRSYFRRNARGTAGNMPKIDHETVRRLPLPLPSYDEQSEIAFLARSSDTHIAALEREIALHEELFRALLEELMSGRLSALPVEKTASGKA